MTRYRNKLYWRIPGGEIQYGLVSKSVTVWFRGRRLLPRRAVSSAGEASE